MTPPPGAQERAVCNIDQEGYCATHNDAALCCPRGVADALAQAVQAFQAEHDAIAHLMARHNKDVSWDDMLAIYQAHEAAVAALRARPTEPAGEKG